MTQANVVADEESTRGCCGYMKPESNASSTKARPLSAPRRSNVRSFMRVPPFVLEGRHQYTTQPMESPVFAFEAASLLNMAGGPSGRLMLILPTQLVEVNGTVGH